MSLPLETDRSTISELTQLRHQILELQQALVHAKQDCPSMPTTVFEATHVGTWEWNSQTNRVTWSHKTEQIFGLSPDMLDHSYEGFLALVHPDDRHCLSAAMTKAINDRSPYSVEYRIIIPTGATRWVACHGHATCSENGPVSGMMGTIEDITARKEFQFAQRALRENVEPLARERTAGSEQAVHDLKPEIAQRRQAESVLKASGQYYQFLYEQTPFIYFTLSPDGTMLSVNNFGEDQLGYQKEDLIGQSILQLFDQKDHQTVLGQLLTCAANPYAVFQREVQQLRKDGGRTWVSVRARAIHDHTHQLLVLMVCEDVTEHKRTEAYIRESETRWRALYEHAGVGIAQLSIDGRFLRVNPHLCALLGYSSETLRQRTFQDLTHPDDLKANLAYLDELLTDKRHSFSMEKRYRRSNDTWAWVDLTVSLVQSGSSDQDYLIAIIQNIDDRKHSYSLLQAAMNSVTDGLLAVDRQGMVTSLNQRFLHLWNIPLTLVDNRNDEQLLNFVVDQLQESEAFWHTVRELSAHPEKKSFDVLTCKDGRVFERYSHPQILDNEIVGRVWSFRDITEHKRAEQALRESELRLQRFVAKAPVGLCILDENWRAITANLAFCQLTGYEAHEIIGSTYALYTHPEDLSASIRLTEEFYRGIRSGYTYEKRYIHKSGEIIWVLVKTTRVDLPGRQGPLLLAAVQDITDRKRALEEREQLSRDLHDNLLQALYAVGMQLEAGKLAMGRSPRLAKTHMSQSIRQLNGLMVDVRRFITLLTERTSVQMDFGQSLHELIASTTDAEGVATQLDITSPVLSFITPQIGEQLLNIAREGLSNSLRHARASRRWLHLSLAHNSIRLLIGDNGIGFSPSRKRRTGGGLANMAARARHLAASFTLESVPRHGTTITVDVPLKKDALHE
ncbi:MAG: PAS domain S-box protein [Nitrospira sp.]|nr:PAS domain S-box protein [Nitrospira sp.]